MDEEITVSRPDLLKIFTAWHAAAKAENWDQRDDPQASADYFIELAKKVKE